MVDHAAAALPPTLLSVWLLGASVGLTACAAACLPFMGAWTLGQGRGGRAGIGDFGAFLLGKVTAYTLLGAIAGIVGERIVQDLNGGVGQAAVGLASVAAGIWLAASREHHAACAPSRWTSVPPVVLGFAISLVPCAPLASLLAVCALSGSAGLGGGYGLVFGLGVALTPLIILLPAAGALGRSLKRDHPWLGRWMRFMGGGALVALGAPLLLGLFRP